jgi:outer membrane protein TolC
MARAQLEEADASVRQSAAAFYPALTLSSSYYRTDNPVQAFSFALNQGKFSLASDVNNPPTADNLQLSAQLRWRVFSARDFATRQAARATQRGTERLLTATDNEVTLRVTRGYLDVLVGSELMSAAEAAVEAYKATEKVMVARVDAGTALKIDLLNIQVERARSEEQQIRAANAHDLARESLAFALGLDTLPDAEFISLEQLQLEEPMLQSDGPRPEIEASDEYVSSARSQLRGAKGGYLPSLTLIAAADRFHGWESDGSKGSWTVGVTAEWAVFDGFLTSSQVKAKRAQLRFAEEEARQVRLQASLDLSTATTAMREATERVAVMSRAVDLASESARLTRLRFEQGLVLSSQIIDAENALVQARAGLAQARADRLYATAALRRALSLNIIGD